MSQIQEVRTRRLRKLEKWLRLMIGLYVVSVMAVGWYYAKRHWGSTDASQHTTVAAPADNGSPSTSPYVAIVEGQPISKEEVDYAMAIVSAGPVVDRLVKETAIIQEAKRQNINLEDPDSRQALVNLGEQVKDPGLYMLREQTLKSRLLLRKLVLKDVPDSFRHRVYEAFKKPLTQYEVFEITAATPADAAAVSAALRQGEPFETVAGRLSKDQRTRRQGGRIGFLTMAQIEDLLGPEAAQSVARVAGQKRADSPVRSPYGLQFFKVGKVLTGYVDLQRSIDTMIFRSREDLLVYQLSHQVKVSYPILELNRKMVAAHGHLDVPGSGSPSSSATPQIGK